MLVSQNNNVVCYWTDSGCGRLAALMCPHSYINNDISININSEINMNIDVTAPHPMLHHFQADPKVETRDTRKRRSAEEEERPSKRVKAAPHC